METIWPQPTKPFQSPHRARPLRRVPHAVAHLPSLLTIQTRVSEVLYPGQKWREMAGMKSAPLIKIAKTLTLLILAGFWGGDLSARGGQSLESLSGGEQIEDWDTLSRKI